VRKRSNKKTIGKIRSSLDIKANRFDIDEILKMKPSFIVALSARTTVVHDYTIGIGRYG
jgi:hypothetical protein